MFNLTKLYRPVGNSPQALFESQNRAHDAVAEVQNLLNTSLILGDGNTGILLKNVSISTAGTTVPHSLGRPFIGWVVTRIRNNSTVFEQPTQPTPHLDIRLDASVNNTVVDLWIF